MLLRQSLLADSLIDAQVCYNNICSYHSILDSYLFYRHIIHMYINHVCVCVCIHFQFVNLAYLQELASLNMQQQEAILK